MGFFSKTKGAAKFAFVTIPAKVLGVGQLRSNHDTLSALYASLRNPICPMCSQGVLAIRDDDAHEAQASPHRKYTWACNKCDFMILGDRDQKTLAPTLSKLRHEQALEVFDALDEGQRQKFQRSHTVQSRIFFGAALVMFVGFCVMLLRGSGFLLSINWLTLAACMFIFGLKKSYRAWQVENGVLFVKGAFKSWFNHERWIR